MSKCFEQRSSHGRTILVTVFRQFIDRSVIGTVFLLLLIGIPAGLNAQTTARGMGLAGAFTPIARGVHAPLYNPANLGLPDNSRFSFTIISMDIAAWNNSFATGMWDQYNGQVLDSLDIVNLLDEIPDEGFRMNMGNVVRGLSFSAGRFAFSFATNVWGKVNLDKSFFRIPLQGTRFDTTYTFDNTEAEAFGFATMGVSYAQPFRIRGLDAFSVGITLRALIAAAYARSESVGASVSVKPEGYHFRADYEALYAYPDSDYDINNALGYGMDLGMAMQFGGHWTFSAGVANVVGSFPGSLTATREIGFYEGDSVGVIEFNEDNISDSSWTIEGEGYSVNMPKVMRAGIAFRDGPILLALDYTQGFTESFMTSTIPQFAIGTEFSGLPWLPLRAGVVFGGHVGFGTSLGIGIRPGGFVLDIAVLNRGFILPRNSKGVMVAFELGIDLAPKKPRTMRVRDM